MIWLELGDMRDWTGPLHIEKLSEALRPPQRRLRPQPGRLTSAMSRKMVYNGSGALTGRPEGGAAREQYAKQGAARTQQEK